MKEIVSCIIYGISMTDILISSGMSLVHRCEILQFFESLHLALAKLEPFMSD
jgi:hypothetical protein